MAEVKGKSEFCVKIQLWENGYLKKTLEKSFFKSEREAESYYNGCEQEGTVVQLSEFRDGGNERWIKMKKN